MQDALSPVVAAAEEIMQIRKHTGKDAPDVTT